MLRSTRLVLLAVLLMLAVGVSTIGAQERSVINIYSGSDTNITDWLQNVVIPAFREANPQYDVLLTSTRAAGSDPIVQRALAALETDSDPLFEIMEADPRNFKDATDAGLWYQPTVEDIPNLANVIEAAFVTENSMPYRGSQVLVAYNSELVAEEDVPTTFAELVEWIKANPGQFVYSRPDKGGSGGNFVVRALYEVAGQDPAIWTPEFDQALVDEYYPQAYALLNEIHPFVYDEGAYPSGNNPVLELFASGEVSMISAWSDQALQGINRGFLPETTKLVQFTDLPLPGGYTQLVVPKNAANLKGAQDFLNFLLSEEIQSSVVTTIGGFPAVGWDLLPAEQQDQFNSVITDTVPLWPGGEYGSALVKGWYETVATNIDPAS